MATTYGQLVELVEHRYFTAVDKLDLDAVLSCFTEDALVTIQTAHSDHEGRDTGLKAMYEELFETYGAHMRHVHFRHVADPENDRIASQFEVELTDREGNTTFLTNCNFFYLQGDKIKRMFVYMSDGVNVLN